MTRINIILPCLAEASERKQAFEAINRQRGAEAQLTNLDKPKKIFH